jgi:hypothetical protein
MQVVKELKTGLEGDFWGDSSEYRTVVMVQCHHMRGHNFNFVFLHQPRKNALPIVFRWLYLSHHPNC